MSPAEASERGRAGAPPDPPARSRPARVCVGVVAGAHGVRGAVRIKSFTAEPADIARYGPLDSESGRTRYAVRLIGEAKGVVIAQLSGIEDRQTAEGLRGLRLYLPRAALPATEEDEYYHADLIGLEAVLADGSRVGQVRAVHDFGAGDMLELVRPGAAPAMVPFTRAVVPVVDLAGGLLVVEPPPGLLEPADNDLPENSEPQHAATPQQARP